MDKNNFINQLEKRFPEMERELKYYKSIAEKNGKRRLREVEQLNRLISDRIKSETALRESEERFRLIALSTNDVFYELKVENLGLKWFGDIEKTLGYEPGEIEHSLENWLSLMHPKDRMSYDDSVVVFKESSKPLLYTYRIFRKDGSVRYWKDTCIPVLNKDGRPIRWIGGVSDITEQKKAEEALIQAQRLGAIGELAHGIAHDFNNSLQGMFGNIELALLESMSPEIKNYLETIKKLAADSASRIRQLQRFSGVYKGKDDYEHVDLNILVDTAISQTKSLWKDESEKTGISITVEKKYSEKELWVRINTGDLRSVLYNLIKNSVEAMPKGGKLIFNTGETENGVCMTIRDTGAGMDIETKTRIFQPFFSTKGFEKGKGLGMSTSYAIIKEHGGELYVKESVLGKGTSIEIRLPHSTNAGKTLKDSYGSGYEGSARILWVDDEEDIRDIGLKMLNRLNHSVDMAASGKDAMSLLQNKQYDLMITDIGMPNMSGWQLLGSIKGNYPEMKIAVVTGWGAEVSNKKKEKYNVGYVLGKPILMGQIKHMVGEVLQLKQN